MSLSPEEQARIATRIGELEGIIARQLAGIQEWERTAPGLRKQAWTDRQIAIHNARLVLDQQREEANTLRAQIGLPLVVAREETPPQPVPAKGTNYTGCFILCIVLGCAVLYMLYNPGVNSIQTRSTAPLVPTKHDVSYYVRGTARLASLTYQNESGGTEQREVGIPWDLNFSADAGDFLYLSAQNESTGGTIDCGIMADGKVVQRASSSGQASIASCSGRVP